MEINPKKKTYNIYWTEIGNKFSSFPIHVTTISFAGMSMSISKANCMFHFFLEIK